MSGRWELAIRLTYVALYAAVCAGTLLMLYPQVRVVLVRGASQQLYAWRLGVHRARRAPMPVAWQALVRSDLPDEPRRPAA